MDRDFSLDGDGCAGDFRVSTFFAINLTGWTSAPCFHMVTAVYNQMRSFNLSDGECRKRCSDELRKMARRIEAGEEIPEPRAQLSGVRSAADMRRLFGTGWKTINRSQQAWIRHLLTLWGQHLGGEDYERGEVNVIGRLMMRCEWSEQKGRQIEKIVSELHCEGFRGEELFRKARDLLIPKSSAANIIALAKESDDAAFVESVMVKTFGRDNPIRNVARLRYCKCKSAQNIATSLIYFTGITQKEARNRIEWALNILEGEMFYAVKREMEKDILPLAA